MLKTLLAVTLALQAVASSAGPIPVDREPQHRIAYADATLRVLQVNLPVGLLALWVGWRHMPDFHGQPRRLDVTGLLLFGAGTALLSWLLEVFGEHGLHATGTLPWLVLAVALLGGYGWHARRLARPLLNLALLRLRTFREIGRAHV